MDYAKFVDEVRVRAGFDEIDEARRATTAVLEIVGQHLPVIDRDTVAAHVPAEIAQFLRRGSYDGDIEARELYEQVSEREGVTIGFALEHAEVVCQVLAEAVDAETRKHLVVHVPRSVARLFEPRGTPTPIPDHVHEHIVWPGAGHTLASGRPGGTTPIADAKGTAHHDSVVRAENPHGDVKLSSAHGLSAERHGETLASGAPGSKRPISDTKG